MCVCIDSLSLGKLSLPLQPLRGLATVREHSHHQLPLCVSLGYNTLRTAHSIALLCASQSPVGGADWLGHGI
jgi:hypothetical protein